jgi:hypothetical protein
MKTKFYDMRDVTFNVAHNSRAINVVVSCASIYVPGCEEIQELWNDVLQAEHDRRKAEDDDLRHEPRDV